MDQAPPMYRDALRSITSYLFLQNTASSLQERDLLVTPWHYMGRAGETGVRHSSNRFVSLPISALQFVVVRTKITTLQTVHAFCDASSWEADIFHTKASHSITCLDLDDTYQFRNTSANAINKNFGRVCGSCDAAMKRYKSHSGPRGCADEALAHAGVSVTEVIARGGGLLMLLAECSCTSVVWILAICGLIELWQVGQIAGAVGFHRLQQLSWSRAASVSCVHNRVIQEIPFTV